MKIKAVIVMLAAAMLVTTSLLASAARAEVPKESVTVDVVFIGYMPYESEDLVNSTLVLSPVEGEPLNLKPGRVKFILNEGLGGYEFLLGPGDVQPQNLKPGRVKSVLFGEEAEDKVNELFGGDDSIMNLKPGRVKYVIMGEVDASSMSSPQNEEIHGQGSGSVAGESAIYGCHVDDREFQIDSDGNPITTYTLTGERL